MIFNSVEYLALFLPATVVLHWLLPSHRARNALLLVASYAFYAAWDARFLALIALTTTVDHTVARGVHRAPSDSVRRRLVMTSATVNLGILALFKYYGFFTDSAVELLQQLGLDASRPTLDLILPVGISFYTFQSLSYVIDVYRRQIEPAERFLDYATYVAFFPQLVAGPIERARELLPQITRDRPRPDVDTVLSGVALIARGLVLKVVIADRVAPIVNRVFGDAAGAGGGALAVAVLAFSIQIYGDFAGYTDIARGSARLFSVDLIVNFRQPYLSPNITVFWRRWHISLSNWLRDYLYIPLGGNRRGARRTQINLLATMLIGGLWHGAAWTFVIWGGLHGLYLIGHRRFSERHSNRRAAGTEPSRVTSAVATAAATVTTFVVTSLTWVFFRADSFGQAFDVLGGLFRWRAGAVDAGDAAMVGIAAALVLILDLAGRVTENRRPQIVRHPVALGAGVGATLVLIALAAGTTPAPFIYFQF